MFQLGRRYDAASPTVYLLAGAIPRFDFSYSHHIKPGMKDPINRCRPACHKVYPSEVHADSGADLRLSFDAVYSFGRVDFKHAHVSLSI
jgi:hypothetical protein